MRPFEFLITAEVSRSEGKFATRDELREQLQEALESADPGTMSGENGGEYNVDNWNVEEYTPPPKERKKFPVVAPKPRSVPDRINEIQGDLFAIREELRDTLDTNTDGRFIRLCAEIGALAEEFLPEESKGVNDAK